MNGAQALINTLVDGGVDVCFANPGTSEMHFVAALDAVPRMRGMLTLFEGVATGAADGYARIAGRPAAVLLHLGPGLGNGLANLHNARRARVPMVVVVGDHATYHKKYDAPLESDIDAVAGTVSGWVRRTEAAADVGADAEAAIAASRSGSQIATLILPADVSSNLARFDAMRYGLRVGDDGTRSAEEVMAMTRAAGFGPEVKRRIMIGTYALSAGYYDAYYNQAQKVRTLIARDLDAAYRSVDVLVSPTTPTTAFRLGEKVDDPLAMYLFDLCTLPLNLAGHCGMSVPSGLSPDDGLPVGLQIMAPALADDRLYRVGAAYEAARGPLLSAI